MKVLLVLMIVFSVLMGIPTNIAFFTLYDSEFTSVFGMIKAGTFGPLELIVWILLLITQAGIVSLLFLTTKKYFKYLLISAPLLFVLFYTMLEGVLILFLLIPFLIVWVVCLIVSRNKRMQTT
jgi:hypothetical protein